MNREQIISAIAKQHMGIETLVEPRLGESDVRNVAVGVVRKALEASYDAGRLPEHATDPARADSQGACSRGNQLIEPLRTDWVYVVSLGRGTPNWSGVSWREIVSEKRIYFHPIGRHGWPKLPPAYLGFRFDARLQAVYPVVSVEEVPCRSHFSRFVPEIDGEACRLAYDGGQRVPHYIYHLGDPMVPERVVATGRIFQAGRVWARLPVLLSSPTISDAVARS